jgi:hypothetical protein
MYREDFTNDFSLLGECLITALKSPESNPLLNNAFEKSLKNNPLFTVNMQHHAVDAVCTGFLQRERLLSWLLPHSRRIVEREGSVGIVMAGNIPLVGFHDLLVVLAAGFRAEVRLSSKDPFLLPAIYEILCGLNDYWKGRVKFVRKISSDACCLFVTGTDQALSYYRGEYPCTPKVERTSRSSIAILTGKEREEELKLLAQDLFLYYGMGCRSVSTLLLPEGYDLSGLLNPFSYISTELASEDFLQAYRYQKALSSLEGLEFCDGGYFIFRKGISFPPPLGVVNHIEYRDEPDISRIVKNNRDRLQCIVGNYLPFCNVGFGLAQFPALDSYADGIDTFNFLLNFD